MGYYLNSEVEREAKSGKGYVGKKKVQKDYRCGNQLYFRQQGFEV